MKDATLTRKSDPSHRSVVALTDAVAVGGDTLLVVGGPCAVESAEQMEQVGHQLLQAPVQALRGGVFKPRTSPYAFQGMGEAGLRILDDLRQRFQMPVISEVMAIDQIELMADYVDVLQVGSRNMQNFDLLKALGRIDKPVLLKRGLAATIEEFVMAAEYILSHGNPSVILCERGIRSFDTYTRNVLDLGAVVALKQITHLPVMVDPSHAAGKRELVPALARAAIAAGADGIMVECHPVPEQSVSDARQALTLEEMANLARSLDPIAAALGRRLGRSEASGEGYRPEPERVLGAIALAA
ncbi:3-deoxy-7-phosphoheptulonate synthase [Nodosilinea nodulosa]|uniref:3-deoxy-7-phosphoheptulonate synthase n=1 Tax=Nodosilinea nodulosa TaxID=416001 RepID=UPI00036E4F47|nr:3-deoxy-7-phosphoheptulonate synthase [Nodosilinea nodulosa]